MSKESLDKIIEARKLFDKAENKEAKALEEYQEAQRATKEAKTTYLKALEEEKESVKPDVPNK